MNNTMTTKKVRAGQPYLYRKNGLPSEVYEIRMTNFVEHSALNAGLDMTMQKRVRITYICCLQFRRSTVYRR